jgi:ABC-type phosphate transport system substrate-binding protein
MPPQASIAQILQNNHVPILVVGIVFSALSFVLGLAAWFLSSAGPGGGLHWASRRIVRILIALALVVAILGYPLTGLAVGYTVKKTTVKYTAIGPSARCDRGSLQIEGSTAFAPIMTMVATEYQLLCPQAQITVTGDGSGQGLSDLEGGKNPPGMAMYDGVPMEKVRPGFGYKKVGDLILAMVGYDGPNPGPHPLPGAIFRQGPGMGLSQAAITQAFSGGGSNIPGLPGVPVQTLGRAGNSGTREAFIVNVANHKAADGTVKPSADSTLDLLARVNLTPREIGYIPDMIGYAEADALPYFPNVREIAIESGGMGYLPTRANALAGKYAFLATERLYTKGRPTGLAADLISFLISTAENAQLRDTSFIGCADLAGSSALKGSC